MANKIEISIAQDGRKFEIFAWKDGDVIEQAQEFNWRKAITTAYIMSDRLEAQRVYRVIQGSRFPVNRAQGYSPKTKPGQAPG